MISVVTALYQSEPYIEEFYRRHKESIAKIGVDFEFVFVSDGSPDASEAVVLRLSEQDPRVRLIVLSRNFGQHAAMFAGIAEAKGEHVYAADCDLEEAPENIIQFYATLHRDLDVDVVYGVLKKRSGGLARDVLGRIFYRILNAISSVSIPRDQAWQRVMTRRYVEALLRYAEVETLPAGLMALAGFRQIPIEIEKPFKGSSTYSFRKRLVLALNSLASFSSAPLIGICMIGIGVTIVSSLVILGIVTAKILKYDFQSGWISLISSIWCVGGMILASTGIVGIYLAKVFNQVKNRPLYIIKKRL